MHLYAGLRLWLLGVVRLQQRNTCVVAHTHTHTHTLRGTQTEAWSQNGTVPETTRETAPKGAKNGQKWFRNKVGWFNSVRKSTRNPLTVPPGTYSLNTD